MRALLPFVLSLAPYLLFGQLNLINSYNYPTNPSGTNSPYEPNSPDEKINFVLPTSDGGYLLVGQYLWDIGDWDMVIRKVNANGQSTAVSISTPGSASEEIAYSAVEYNGFYYVTGSYSYYENNAFVAVDCFLGKYDANLNLADWTSYFFPGYEHFVGTSIIEIGGQLIIGGTAKSSNATQYPNPPPTEGAIFRVSPTTLGVQEVETNLGTGVFKLENSADGNFYVFGEYFNVNNSSCANVYDGPFFINVIGDIDYYGGYYSDIFVRKFTSSFNNALGWNGFEIIGGNSPDTYVDGIATPDGGFAVLGYTDCNSTNGNSGPNNICYGTGSFRPFWLYKGTSSGNFHWNRSIQGGIGGDYGPFGIINSCNDGAIILGEQYTAFVDYVTTWSSMTSAQTTNLGTFTVKGLGSDIKRGANGEIVVGGWYFSSNKDLGFYRYSSEPCSNICNNPITISCNSPWNGNNTGPANLQSSYACTGADQFTFLANEQIFEYYHDGNADFEVVLTSNNIDHDLFLFDNCTNALSNCLGASLNSVNNGLNYEALLVSGAPAGYYYIVVDGEFGNTEGPFTLTVNCCANPVQYDNCGQLSYTYNNFNLNYTFSAAQLNDYATNTDWLINDTPVTPTANSTQLTYSFPGDASYTICAPYFNQSGCIDYCCETYCIAEQANCLRGLILPCDQVCACSEGPNSALPAPFQCENFESYQENDAISTESSFWTQQGGALDGFILADGEENQVLRLAENDLVTPSINYNFFNGEDDNLTCGRYRLSWDMLVQQGQSAAFRFLYEKTEGNSPQNTAAIFNFNTNNSGNIDAGEGNFAFDYPNGSWFKVMFIIDLNREQLEFWLDHNLVYVNDYATSLEEDYFNYDLGTINFYGDVSADYLIDNLCVRTTKEVDCGDVSNAVCSQSGQQYDNSCLATNRGLYTPLELEACLNVCNYSATYIGRSDDISVSGFLNTYEQAPPNFYSDQTITGELEEFYGFVPYPLYADYYIFQNEENGVIGLDHDQDLLAFVFQCVCDESGCSSPFVGTTQSLEDEALDEGLYYIVLVGPDPNTGYGINVFPNGPCVIEPNILNCGSSLTDQDFTNAFNDFSNPAANTSCYLGINTYPLADKVYRLEIDEARIVDLTLDATGGAAGLFLYNYACGTSCVDYAETSIFGGSATISGASLSQGIYYLLVDQQTPVSSFSLSVSCESDQVNTFLTFYDSGTPCPTDPEVTHEVRLDLSSVNDPELGPTDVFSLQIRPPATDGIDEDLNAGIFSLVNNALSSALVFPLLEQYNGGLPEERCSFLFGDTIAIVLERDNQIRILNPVYATDLDLPSVNAGSTFQEGGISAIIDYQIVDAGLNLNLPDSYITFGAEDQLVKNLLIGIIGENTTTWQLVPEDTYDWLNVNVSGAAPYTGLRILGLTVDPNDNPGYGAREAFLLFQTTTSPFITRRIRLVQRARCVPPEVSIEAQNMTGPFQICDNESISLQAITTGPDSLYNFFWNDEPMNTGPNRFIPNLAAGDNNWSVLVEQVGCTTDLAEVLISVTQTPPQPSLNTTSISSCGGEETFMVLNDAGMVTYEWTNAAGIIVDFGPTFSPEEDGTYSVIARNTQNTNCVSPPTALTYSNINLVANNETTDNVVCLGETISLSVSTNLTSADLNYSWSNGIAENAASVSYTPTVAGNQTITVNVSLGECETGPVPIPIQVVALPDSPDVANVIDCEDNPAPSLAVINPLPEQTYQWFSSPTIGTVLHTGASYQPPANVGTTNYWVEASVNSCASTRTQVIYTIVEGFDLSLMADQTSICFGEPVQLSTAITGNTANLIYLWSNNVDAQDEQATLMPTGAPTETVVVEVSNGPCVETASLSIDVDAPASFDSDPVDVPEANCADNLLTYEFSFNTDGNLLNAADLPIQPLVNGQSYLMTGIPVGTDFTLEIGNGECMDSYIVSSPACSCTQVIPAPMTGTPEVISCSDDPVAELTVSVTEPEVYTAFWYDGPGTNANLVNQGLSLPNPVPGVYYVETVDMVNNCSSDALQISYQVVEDFDLALTADQTSICLDEDVQLSTIISGNMANLTYTWSSNVLEQGAQAVFMPDSPQTETVSVEVTNGPCTETASLMLSVDAPPSFTSDPLEVPEVNCAENLQTYTFDFTTDGNTLNMADLPVTPSVNGQNYTLSGIPVGQDFELMIGNGECIDAYPVSSPVCACTQVIPLVSSENPMITICQGEPVPDLVVAVSDPEELTAYWYDGPGAEAAIVYQGLVLSDPDPGNYYVEAVSLVNGCSSEARFLISLTIAEPISVTVEANAAVICENELLTLTTNVSGGATPGSYTYEWSGDLGQSPDVTIPGISGTQVYFVTVTDQEDVCQNVGVTTVQGLALPNHSELVIDCLEEDAYTVDFTTDASTLNTSLGTGIIQNLGNNNYRLIVPAGTNLELFLSNEAEDAACALPAIQILAPDCSCIGANIPMADPINTNGVTAICSDQSSGILEVMSPPEGMVVQWYSDPELDPESLLSQGNAFEIDQAGNYYAIIFDPASNCSGNLPTTLSLVINDLPTVEAGEDQLVCFGETTQLSGNGSGIGSLDYLWQSTTPLSDNSSPTPEVQPTEGANVFTLQITDDNGCSNTDMVTLTGMPSIDAGILEIQGILCADDETGELQATHQSAFLPVSALWSTEAIGPTISGLGAGNYSLTLTDDANCTQTASYSLNEPTAIGITEVFVTPVIFDVGASTPGSLAVEVSGGTPPYSFSWVGQDGFPVGLDSVYSTDVPGLYQVVITDQNGCEEGQEIGLTVGTEMVDLPEGSIRVYPNPTRAELHLQFDLATTETALIRILDGLGQEVHQQKLPHVLRQTMVLDLAPFPSGVYWIMVQTDSGRFVEQILKIE